jgi:hypothetical protein
MLTVEGFADGLGSIDTPESRKFYDPNNPQPFYFGATTRLDTGKYQIATYVPERTPSGVYTVKFKDSAGNVASVTLQVGPLLKPDYSGSTVSSNNDKGYVGESHPQVQYAQPPSNDGVAIVQQATTPPVTPAPSVASAGSITPTTTARADGLQDSDKQAIVIVLSAVGAVLVGFWLAFGRKKKSKVTA